MSILIELSLAPWLRAGGVYLRLGGRDWFVEWGA